MIIVLKNFPIKINRKLFIVMSFAIYIKFIVLGGIYGERK